MNAQRKAETSGNFRRRLVLALLAALCWAQAEAREDGAKPPVAAPARARLIDGGFFDGARYAGVEIELPGDAVTYWRDPGDAGAPPQFDFAASENVAAAEPLYPQPERLDEGGATAFGYRRAVIFPIRVTPREKDKPAVLALSLDYAVCEKLCLPVHADLRLALPPEANAHDGKLAEALKNAPRRLDAAQAAVFATLLPRPAEAGGKPQWLLRLAAGAARDIFVESPQGFFVESAPASEEGAFLLTLAEHPEGKTRPDKPLRVTVAGPAPVEFDLTLP